MRGEAALLSSLVYFKPSYMSLSTPHPLWSMAESLFEVSKASTVATMLSGRYVSDYRARHWSRTNPDGHCQICQVTGNPSTPGTLEHLLLKCPALSEVRANSISHWVNYMVGKPALVPIVSHHTLMSFTRLTPGNEGLMQLLLDPSSCPMVIASMQKLGVGILTHLLYMTRTWCHAHHLKRRRLLKLHNII